MKSSSVVRGLVGLALATAIGAGVIVGLQTARSQGQGAKGKAAPKKGKLTKAEAAAQKALEDEKKAMDARKADLDKRAAALKREKERVEELEEKAAELASRAETRCLKCKGAGSAKDKKALSLDFKDPQRVAVIIKKMKPRDAAAIMAKWPQRLSIDTLWRLSPRITSPILSKMEPQQAARLLARMRAGTPGGSRLVLPTARPAPVAGTTPAPPTTTNPTDTGAGGGQP